MRALIKDAGGGDPAEIIRLKARRLVQRAKELGWSGPPYDPLQLASLLGIKPRPTRELFTAEAQLRPVAGRQLLLEFNPDRPPGRRNYSVCHEIVHTFFRDCYELIHQRKANPRASDPEAEVEQLCQIGAAELLMPEEDFAADLKQLCVSLRSVSELKARYRASREAVIRRLVQIGGRLCAAPFLSQRLAPRERAALKSDGVGEHPSPKMRVLYSATSPKFAVFIPPHKSVPDDSCVYRARVVDEVVTQKEHWGLSGAGLWHVEAMALPSPVEAEDAPAAVALVFPQ